MVSDDAVPFALLRPDAPALIPQSKGVEVSVCLVGKDDALVITTRTLDASPRPTYLLRSLAAEVSEEEAGRGLHTAFTDPSMIASVGVRAGTARVDLKNLATTAGTAPALAVAQVVCTLTSQPGIGLVSFTVDGVPAQVPLPDGSLIDGPVSRDDFKAWIAP